MVSIEEVLRPLEEAGLVLDRVETDEVPEKNLLSCTIFGDGDVVPLGEDEITAYHWVCYLSRENATWVVTPHGFVPYHGPRYRLQSLDEAVALILRLFHDRLVGIYDGHKLVKNDQRVFEEWRQNRQLLATMELYYEQEKSKTL